MSFLTIENLKSFYGVKSHKETKEGFIAIHKKLTYNKEWFWMYFKWDNGKYIQTGSTRKYEN